MTALTDTAADAAIAAACTELHLPTVRTEAPRLADQAAKANLTHRAYLAEVLLAEVDDRAERRRQRRVHEARFPRTKRLADFDTGCSPVTPATVAALAEGRFIEAGEPVCFVGDSGTGKSHLLIGTGVAACEAGRRVRYTTAAALVNELVEAADARTLSRLVARYGRLDLLCLDELPEPRHEGGRAALPGAHRAGGAGVGGRRHQLHLQRARQGVQRPAPRRGGGGPAHLPLAHRRDGHRVVPAPLAGALTAAHQSWHRIIR